MISVQSDPSVFPTTFTYDPMGRLYRTGQDTNLWTHLYDGRNRLWKKTDPMDNTTEFGYDAADRVNMVKLPSGRTYGFAFDPSGNRTQVIMPNLAVHTLGYSPVNLDNSYTPPGNPSYSHGYSPDREWTRTVLPGGRAIDAAYDTAGRLQSISYPEAAISYMYNDGTDRVFSLSRRDTLDNTSQTIDYDYDGSLKTMVSFSGSAGGTYRYSYDNNFFLVGVTLDNVFTPLERDADGLLTGYGPFTYSRGGPAGATDNVTDMLPRTCGLDNTGNPVPCATGTLLQTYGYDPFGRMDRRPQAVNGIPIYEEVLTRDPAGKITRKVETVAGSAHTFDYAYDVDGQLWTVHRDGALVEQYGYDNNANRTSTLAATASYDAQDRMISVGGVTYQFDADGFLTARGNDQFVYSARGELLSAVVAGQAVTYQYDGTNRRIGRTDASGTYLYLYGDEGNPFRVTATRNPVDNGLTTYSYDETGTLFSFERNGQRYYVASDHLGTPKVVTDNTGNVLRVMEYDSWGVKTFDNNVTFDLPVGFAGGIPDDSTGLVRFGFRDYEAGAGRWTAKDPIFFQGGQNNLFQYVENNPLNLNDQTGLQPVDWYDWDYGGTTSVCVVSCGCAGITCYCTKHDHGKDTFLRLYAIGGDRGCGFWCSYSCKDFPPPSILTCQ